MGVLIVKSLFSILVVICGFEFIVFRKPLLSRYFIHKLHVIMNLCRLHNGNNL